MAQKAVILWEKMPYSKSKALAIHVVKEQPLI